MSAIEAGRVEGRMKGEKESGGFGCRKCALVNGVVLCMDENHKQRLTMFLIIIQLNDVFFKIKLK